MKLYGCHNREPYVKEFKAQDGWVNGKPFYKWVKFRMSPECNYRHTDLGKQDKMCEGCKWK